MKVSYDPEPDILYITIRKGPAFDSEELSDDVRVEYDRQHRIIGIEISDARKYIGKAMAEEIANRVKAVAT